MLQITMTRPINFYDISQWKSESKMVEFQNSSMNLSSTKMRIVYKIEYSLFSMMVFFYFRENIMSF